VQELKLALRGRQPIYAQNRPSFLSSLTPNAHTCSAISFMLHDEPCVSSSCLRGVVVGATCWYPGASIQQVKHTGASLQSEVE